MKVVKCDKNHYYDADKYETCPHCKNGLKKYKKEEYDVLDFGSVSKHTSIETDNYKSNRLEYEQNTVLLENEQTNTVLLGNESDETALLNPEQEETELIQ